MVYFDRNQGLFWSNTFGFTGLGTADTFTTDEVSKFRPPLRDDGFYCECLDESDARILV